MADCSCGAKILWAVTPSGKSQPFDREPNPQGNRILLGRGPRNPPLALEASMVMDIREVSLEKYNLDFLYMPHHVTCPNANDFRKKG